MLNSFFSFLIRIFAFVRKEILTIVRQPRLLFSLILGPFLILLIFGIGYRDTPRTLRTLVIVPEGSPILGLVEQYTASFTNRIEFLGITTDATNATDQLREGNVDLVVVAPLNPMVEWENNEQSLFSLYHAEVDPFEVAYIQVLGDRVAEAINKQVLLAALEETKQESAEWQASVSEAKVKAATVRQELERGNGALGQETAVLLQQDMGLLSLAAGSSLLLFANLAATGDTDVALPAATLHSRLESIQDNLDTLVALEADDTDLSQEILLAEQVERDLTEFDTLLTQFQEIDSQVLVAPFRSETLSVGLQRLDPTHFYIPAVISLLLQHIAITMACLSIVGERRGGAIEFFQAAPVSALETLLGKYISFFLLTAVLGAILTGLVIWGMGMPMLGSWGSYALTITGVLSVSLGIGFIISLAAQTNSQAIQYAMIILLASIFFSGFFLPLYRLWEPVRVISWLLPATYGTDLLQSIMLRGQPGDIVLYVALLLFSLLFFLIAWRQLRRQMARL